MFTESNTKNGSYFEIPKSERTNIYLPEENMEEIDNTKNEIQSLENEKILNVVTLPKNKLEFTKFLNKPPLCYMLNTLGCRIVE